MPRRVHFISLGCPKNRVDSEVMLGLLDQAQYEIIEDPAQAHVIIVNTCAFIEQSKTESIDTILEMAEYKKNAQCDTLMVTGCLAQRYPQELAEELPEVDHFLGTGDYPLVVEVLQKREQGRSHMPRTQVGVPDFAGSANLPRLRTQKAFSQYLKISEGCSNTCSFCIIPTLRGKQKSRSIKDLAEEATRLVEQGCSELNLIGQDLTAYGFDLPERPKLTALLENLENIPSLEWIRLLYAYPRTFNIDLIRYMAASSKLLPYIDMPLQHISDRMLRAMRRGKAEKGTRDLLDSLRLHIPHLVIRTTFITGFPGETEEDFQTLRKFVQETEFDHVGVFTYSQEEGTKAYAMQNQVPHELALERQAELLSIQKKVSKKKLAKLKGKTLKVLVEGSSEETDLLLQGRYAGQAPEIDGCVYINEGEAAPGDYAWVKITQTAEYDLVGKLLEIVQPAKSFVPTESVWVSKKSARASLPIIS